MRHARRTIPAPGADPQVRIVAAQELGSATDPIVALHLLEPVFRTDPVMWVRMEAAFSIGKLHLRDGTALLLAMAESPTTEPSVLPP